MTDTDYRLTPLQRIRCNSRVLILATALEEIEKTPDPNFKWFFAEVFRKEPECTTTGCAMGYGHIIWPEAKLLKESEDFVGHYSVNEGNIREFFGMSQRACDAIFWGGIYDEDISPILPSHVAAELRLFASDPAAYEAKLLLGKDQASASDL